MLLNIGKRHPSPVMNTPGSLNSPVVNTPGSLSSPVVNTLGNFDFPVMNTPVSRLLCVLWTSPRTGLQKKLSGDKQFWSQDSPMYSSQGSLAYLMYKNYFRSLTLISLAEVGKRPCIFWRLNTLKLMKLRNLLKISYSTKSLLTSCFQIILCH